MKRSVLLLLAIGWYGMQAQAQNFKGSAIFGSNFSHVRGDGMVGYTKPGLNIGFRVAYPMGEKSDLSMAMRYTQKGSRRTYTAQGASRGGIWHLWRANYVEVPITFHYQLLNKIEVNGGLAIARLIGTYKSDYIGGGEVPVDFARDFEYSFQLGGAYTVNEKYELFIRHSTSLFSVQKDRFSTFLHPWSQGLIHMVAMFGIERNFN